MCIWVFSGGGQRGAVLVKVRMPILPAGIYLLSSPSNLFQVAMVGADGVSPGDGDLALWCRGKGMLPQYINSQKKKQCFRSELLVCHQTLYCCRAKKQTKETFAIT